MSDREQGMSQAEPRGCAAEKLDSRGTAEATTPRGAAERLATPRTMANLSADREATGAPASHPVRQAPMPASASGGRSRWGEDWLVALTALVGGERSAAGPFAGCLLSAAIGVLNIPGPMGEGGMEAEGPLAELAARARLLFMVVDLLARRAVGRSTPAAVNAPDTPAACGSYAPGTVVLTPVFTAEVENVPGEALDGPRSTYEAADEPLVLCLAEPSTEPARPARWRPVDDPAASPEPLEHCVARLDADDVFLYLELGFAAARAEAEAAGTAGAAECADADGAASSPARRKPSRGAGARQAPCRPVESLAEIPAPGMEGLFAGESWLVPVAGSVAHAGAAPEALVASPATERTVQLRAYGTLPATDEQLALADAVRVAATAKRGLGLYDRLGHRAAVWPCRALEGGATFSADALWPVALFPRSSANRWPLLAVASDGTLCVVDLAEPALARCEATPLASARERRAPDRDALATPVDCWDVPGAEPSVADVRRFAEGIRLHVTEVRRASGEAGNVLNKIAVLAEHGWREEALPTATGAEEGSVWVSPAPLQLVGFAEFWRFVLRFGASILVDCPVELRERHLVGALERVARFAERIPAVQQRKGAERGE